MDDFISNGTINARGDNGWYPVEAYILDNLAIQDSADGYIITHVGTGRIVLRADYACDFSTVLVMAERLQPLFDDMPHTDWLPGREKPSAEFMKWLKGIEPTLRQASWTLGKRPYWIREVGQ